MIHFYLPYIPGQLRAEGYQAGRLVATDALYSDHEAETLHIDTDRTQLPADGHSVAFVDLALEDRHGIRYMLEDRLVIWHMEGSDATVLADNGNAWSLLPFDASQIPMHNGHVMLIVKAGRQKGEAVLCLNVQGFEARRIAFHFT